MRARTRAYMRALSRYPPRVRVLKELNRAGLLTVNLQSIHCSNRSLLPAKVKSSLNYANHR